MIFSVAHSLDIVSRIHGQLQKGFCYLLLHIYILDMRQGTTTSVLCSQGVDSIFETSDLIETIERQIFQISLIPHLKSSQRFFGLNYLQCFVELFAVYFYLMKFH